MKKTLKWVVIVLVLIVAGLQLTNPAHTNPASDASMAIENMTSVPPDVALALTNSCSDCHSNQTNWRWYTYVAPVSWFTVGHVDHGRTELNFSEWGTYGTRMKDTRLKAICEQIQKGLMPLASYALVHPGVRLSPERINAICEWTKQERQRLSNE